MIESTTVRLEMIAMGTPYCTERLIVPTSRVTRVTRSPLLALSTRPSGRARMVRTMYSRADDSRSWPKIVEVRWATNVSRAWAQTTPTISNASELSDVSASPATVSLINEPSRRGTTRPVAAARPLRTTSTTKTRRRSRRRVRKNASTARLSATGQPRSGLRDWA